MHNTIVRRLICFTVALATFTGCGLLEVDFDGEVTIDFEVDTDDNQYNETFLVNPAENEDVRENQDRIESGRIREIVFSVEGVPEHNRATYGSGEFYAHLVGEEWPALTRDNALAVFDETPVSVGQTVVLAATQEQNDRLSELLFPEGGPREVEAMMLGRTDQAPLAFLGRLIISIEITASP